MLFFKKLSERRINREEKNKKLRERYDNNLDGYKDKCEARNTAYRLRKIEGKCYLCMVRKATQRHHPDYTKPKLIFPLCIPCHRRLHKLLKMNERRLK